VPATKIRLVVVVLKRPVRGPPEYIELAGWRPDSGQWRGAGGGSTEATLLASRVGPVAEVYVAGEG
jgi:hypothetical protein